MGRKPLALLLAAALLCQSLVFPAFAEDTYDDETQWVEWEGNVIDDPEYTTQEDSIPQAALEGGEITAEQLDYLAATDYSDCLTRDLTQDETLRKGIDVSQFNGIIDWKAVANSGVEFAFVRVGYRGWGTGRLAEDTYYRRNIQGALDAGLQVGVYVYSQAITVEEGIEEAQFLIERISDYDITLPLIIDYEYADGPRGRLYEAKLSKAGATNICSAFCYTAKQAGYAGAVYANLSMLRGQLNADELPCVWLAHYVDVEDGPARTYYTGDYDFWQFTSSGAVAGISGRVDLNFWFDDGSFGELQDWIPFLDVSRSSWMYAGISDLYQRGLVNGTSNTTYSPRKNTYRCDLVTILYRMAGEPEVTGTTTFTDLTQEYYRDAVTWAVQEGVVTGISATKFAPKAEISRQDLVTMLYRMEGEPDAVGSLSGFADSASVANYAQNAMVWAVAQGIIQGSGGQLKPRDSANRAEVAAILSRYLKLQA